MLTDANKKSNSKSSKKSKKKGVKNAKKCKKNAFFCEICNYTSNRKTEYKRHLTTKKHKTNTSRLEYFNEHPDLDTNMLNPLSSKQKSSQKKYVCACGKVYAHNSSFTRHKKKCIDNDNMLKQSYKGKQTDNSEYLIEKLLKKCDDIENMMSTPKIINNTTIHNNNNQINMGIFLNENCKDAMNIREFVKSINYHAASWNTLKNDDYFLSLKNLIVENLSGLDIEKRPIHCTDSKKKILYIKDDNLWEKDDNKCFIKKTIREISNNKKNADVIIVKEWRTNNPKWMNNDCLTNEYLTVSEKPFQKMDEVEEMKIIDEISKVTILEKGNILKDGDENNV